jgi:hypothetical protein
MQNKSSKTVKLAMGLILLPSQKLSGYSCETHTTKVLHNIEHIHQYTYTE